MEVDKERCYVNFNDSNNPVPGSAADVAKRQREAKVQRVLDEHKADIDKASEDFPAFGRIMDIVMKK